MVKYFFSVCLIVLTSLYLLVACKNQETNAVAQPILPDSTLLNFNAPKLPVLAPNAKLIIENWAIFKDFETESNQFNNLTLGALKIKSKRMLTQIDSIEKSIPDTLKNNAIQARVTIVKTRLALLDQEINRDKTLKENINHHLLETHQAIQHFILQIQEKFQKDIIDLQRKDDEELEKQKRFKDSIFKLELNDQKKNITFL